MNVVILTQDAPAYVPITIHRLLTVLDSSNINVVGFIAVPAFSRRGFFPELFQWFKFYGPIAFALMSMYSMKNRILSGFGIPSTPSSIMRKRSIRELDSIDVNSCEFVEFVRENEVDVVVSIAFPKKISERVIKSPRISCINFHDGLLPKYRGRLPIFWAMLNEETEVGLTVHEMDQEFDNGPILVQERMTVRSGESLHSLLIRAAQRAPDLLSRSLSKLADDDSSRLPNPAEQASYFGFPTPGDGRRFRTSGKRFFV